MRQRSTRLLLVFILLLTTFSVLVTFPTDPDRYLPGFIPWPKAECAGPICIGKGIDLFGMKRREMRLGLDLKGGTRLVLEADLSQTKNVNLNDAMNTAKDIVDRRVNAFGVAESIVERVGANRLQVQLPGISADQAVSEIGRTAQLQFMEMATDASGNVIIDSGATATTDTPGATAQTTQSVPLSQVLADPSLIQKAHWVPITEIDSQGIQRELNGSLLNRSNIYLSTSTVGLPVLNFGLNSEGGQLMQKATTRLSSPPQPIAFFLDGKPILDRNGLIVAPLVQSTIADQGTITGLNIDDARTLQKLLTTGAFPVPLNVVEQDEVDATLGDQAVVDSVHAGIIAIFVVMAFMIAYYRLPGVLASLALFVYVSTTMMVFKMWPVTVTSAGMAAFVLSVGMAVDANILIFERMKEELRLGRSLVNAIDAGFSRAWTSIRDSNVSTLITCMILYWFGDQFGAALVKGFALTLALGVLVSLFSAIIVTRTFLHTLVGTSVMRHLWLFGDDVEEARHAMIPAPTITGASAPRSSGS